MKPKAIKAVAWKEIRVLLRMVWPVPLLIYGAIVFGVMFGVGYRGGGIVAAVAVVMFWSAFILSRHLFFSERLNRTIVNLLASPLTLEETFLGKVAVCFTASFAAAALAAISYTVYIALRHGELPSAMELVATFVTVPVWGVVLTELLGISFLLFGSRILGWIAAAVLLFLIGPWGGSGKLAVILSRPVIPITSGLVIALLLYLVVRRIEKEWMTRVLS